MTMWTAMIMSVRLDPDLQLFALSIAGWPGEDATASGRPARRTARLPRGAMGQQCSCLQHPPKYQRRVSDASDADDDGATELGSIHVHRSGDELAGLLATDASGKAALQSQEEEEEKLGEGGGLLATEQLMLERLDDGLLSRGSSQQVLRSYQAATGVVRSS